MIHCPFGPVEVGVEMLLNQVFSLLLVYLTKLLLIYEHILLLLLWIRAKCFVRSCAMGLELSEGNNGFYV